MIAIEGRFNVSCDVLVNPIVPDRNITWEIYEETRGEGGREDRKEEEGEEEEEEEKEEEEVEDEMEAEAEAEGRGRAGRGAGGARAGAGGGEPKTTKKIVKL